MSIDLKTVNVEPIRRTFDHLVDKLGPDKNPTRYQEAVWGLQPKVNFHYRPTWDPAHDLYDPGRTAVCGGKGTEAQHEVIEKCIGIIDALMEAIRPGVSVADRETDGSTIPSRAGSGGSNWL